MSNETKDEIAAERDRLQAEVENLRGQLAAAGATRGTAAPVQHTFELSEGQRQELEQHGNTQVDGRYLDVAEVRSLLGAEQKRVEINEPEQMRVLPREVAREKIAGIDFIYPSVEYGKLDPKVSSAPGLNGPAADASPDDE